MAAHVQRVFAHLEALQAELGREFAVSDWLAIDQSRIDRFADATGDHQWIHVDPARAAAGPFGGTIAHGFLTLSLLPALMEAAWRVEGTRMAINYGLDRVRFTNPVRSGSRVRARFKLLESKPVEGGRQLMVEATVEIEGQPKPACVAQMLVRHFP